MAIGLVLAMAAGSLPAAGAPAPENSTAAGQPSTADVGGEIVELRTDRSKTYRDPDGGGLVQKLWSAPVHFKDGDSWRDIKTRFVREKGDQFGNAANDFKLLIHKRANPRALVRMMWPNGTSIAWGMEGLKPGTPAVVDDHVARYENALPGVDVELRSAPSGVKEDLILRSASAPRVFVFPLTLRKLTASVERDGKVVVLRDSEGKEHGAIPPGYMVDSLQDADEQVGGEESFGVHYELVEHKGGQALKVTLDDAWLDDPKRVYPVRVDPSYNSQRSYTSYDDTYTAQPTPVSGPGDRSSLPYLRIGRSAVLDSVYTNRTRRTYLHFYGVPLGNGAQITDATLRMTVKARDEFCSDRLMSVHRITQPWSGWNVTSYDTAPSSDSYSLATTTANCYVNSTHSFNTQALRSTVQGWDNGSVPNYGLMLRAGDETDAWNFREFYSRDASVSDSTYLPHLVIHYNLAPYVPYDLQPGGWTTVTTTTPTLSAVYSDPDQDNGRLFFEVRRTDDYALVASGEGNTAYHGNRSYWTVPWGALTEGKSYQWRARAKDWPLNNPDGQYSGWSGETAFWVNAPPYAPSSLQPAANAVLTTLTPQLSAVFSDPDFNSGYVYFQVYRSADNAPVAEQSGSWVASGSRSSWTTPKLPNNTAYWWRATSVDQHGRQSSSVTSTFRTAVPNGVPSVSVASPADATRFDTFPALRARYVDPDGDAGVLRFRVYDRHGAMVLEKVTNVASGADGSWTPTGLPADTYTWHVQAEDNFDVSGYSSLRDFYVMPPLDGQAIGKRDFWDFYTVELTDRLAVNVNVANGNLVVDHTDLQIKGLGVDMAWGRHFNGGSGARGAAGRRWLTSAGSGVGLAMGSGGTITYEGPSGFRATFSPPPAGSNKYSSTDAPRGSLRKETDGTYTLKMNKSGERLRFSAGGYLTAHESRNGDKISYEYTTAGETKKLTDTRGRAVTFAYTGGRLDKVTDAAGRVVDYTHDAAGRLTEVVDADGKSTRFVYNASDRIARITDPDSRVTEFTYSGGIGARVATLTRVEAGGTRRTTQFDYYAAGSTACTSRGFAATRACTTVKDARNYVTAYEHDDRSRVTKVRDANGHSKQRTYDANSNVEQYQDALPAATTFKHSQDGNDNLMSAQLPTGATWTYDYTDTRHPDLTTMVNNPQGTRRWFAYDDNGNLHKVGKDKDATDAHTLDYYPEKPGVLKIATDPAGAQTVYSYNTKWELTRIDHPAPLGDDRFGYDALSRMTSHTDGRGMTTTYSYDNLDRVTRIAYADGSEITYAYDGAGNRTRMEDQTGTTTYEWDHLGRLTRENLPLLRSNSYGYDAVGNMTRFTDAAGDTTFSYGPVNETFDVVEPGGHRTDFWYDANDRRELTWHANGITEEHVQYDDAGQITRIWATNNGNHNAPLTDFRYSYKNPHAATVEKQPTTLRWSMTDAVRRETTTYDYRDPLDRLVGAETRAATTTQTLINSWTYNYDSRSNLSSQVRNGSTTTYSYNAANQMTRAGTSTYGYDLAGNQTSGGGQTLTYDAKGHTTSITLSNGEKVDLAYTGATQQARVKAGYRDFTNSLLGVTAATDRPDPSTNVNNTSTTSTAAASDPTAPAVLPTTYWGRDDSGKLISQRTHDGNPLNRTVRHFYLFDGLGSVRAVVSEDGVVQNRYNYDPYGQRLTGTIERVPNPWKFAGGYHDAKTDKTKFGIRYYQSGVARWTQQDPISNYGNPPELNRYSYAGCDPVNSVDPSGSISCGATAIIAGLIGAALGVVLLLNPLGLAISGVFISATALKAAIAALGAGASFAGALDYLGLC